MATSQFEAFKQTLKKVFMLDQADLDFGIYRIMNQKRADIEKYLNENLKAQVKETLENNKSSQLLELENEVYSHLTTFFSRYYDSGDFVSQRRYKKDVYAIPYEGEEVKLHWANADQYYIKTGEYFHNYRFKLDNSKYVEFTLKEATTEQNNNKTQNNMERRFAIYEECPCEVINDELHINFTYELYPKATKQKGLIESAYKTVIDLLPGDFKMELLVLKPTESDKKRTLLQRHLNDYVARNTFDYFIHKDLKGFLSRELDFYIKNEVLEIDDIDARTTDSFIAHLTAIKAIKNVGAKIIEFLASLENFQKRLWLKKKMVVSADYCITLDRVPESLYAEICTNDAQREEWVSLFAIDEIKGSQSTDIFSQSGSVGYSVPLTINFLKENPFLVLDTAFFSEEFKRNLISSIDGLDKQCDGLLINSDNFHSIRFLSEKQKSIDLIYIDPPYNTSENGFIYKNNYKHSSWASMINDRVIGSKRLLSDKGVFLFAIDDTEYASSKNILSSNFGDVNYIGTTAVEVNPAGQNIRPNVPARSHDYFHAYAKNIEKCQLHLRGLTNDEAASYTEQDAQGFYLWDRLRRRGGNSRPSDRPKQWYPIFRKDFILRVPKMSWNLKLNKWNILEKPNEGEVEEWPIDPQGENRIWRTNYEGTIEGIKNGDIQALIKNGKIEIFKKSRMPEGKKPKTLWYDSIYSATSYGTKLLIDIFGNSPFSYAKSINLVEDCIYYWSDNNSTVFDYFAGSGTTAHAVINLNRKYKDSHKKYILCEMGDYFYSATKPRIEKVIYSQKWKNGKPVDRQGSSHCFKYMRLEQYEDTLNNLVIHKNTLMDQSGEFYDGFMLGYLLDTETKDSLFSLEWFRNPWNTKLKITRNNEMKDEKVDLVETFNYLIGLNVQKISYPKSDICVVEGYNRKNEHILVIWRDCDKVSNKDLDDFFTRMAYSTRDNEFDKIYVNGDNNLENLKTDTDTWKVTLIEQEFSNKMFETEE